jgi:hypothetical protein
MPWLPIGPDFTFGPIHPAFLRLSRRNEGGEQGLVSAISVDQTDPSHIYAAVRPSTGGSAAFRTDSGGTSWIPLSDDLQQSDPTVSPSFVAVNPSVPNIVYLFTDDGRCFKSTSRGDAGTWGAASALGGYVRIVRIDPNTAATPATTHLYAAGTDGVWRSSNGGSTWKQLLTGDTWSFVADFSVAGTPKLYAGVFQQGLFYTDHPAGGWTNLNAGGIGLPTYTGPTTALPDGSFNAVMVDRCPANGRLYVLLGQRLPGGGFGNDVVAGLYTSSAPSASWTQITLPASPPEPSYGFYDWSFAVAPNSPGDGTSDILYFGGLGVVRSTDSGRTWVSSTDDFHADHHAFAFAPESYNAGAIPDTFMGTDGGIFRSDRWSDPSFDFGQTFTNFDDQYTYSDTGAPENLNHGLQSVACLGYGSDPSVPALGYVGCQDTGLQGGTASLGWRSLEGADGNQVAAALGPNGMSVWNVLGEYGGWPTFQVHHWTDHGNFSSPSSAVSMPANGSLVAATSNLATGLDTLCLAGLATRSPLTTLTAAITAPGTQTAHAASLAGVVEGALLVVDTGAAREGVVATSVTATTFSADFGSKHPVGAPILLQMQCVGRIDHTGSARQISQDFGARGVRFVTASPVNADLLYCVTGDNLLWNTTIGSSADASTVWAELPSGMASGYGISTVAVDQSGDVYVLLTYSVNVQSGETTFSTPLFKVGSGSWTGISCTDVPSGGPFGWLAADPARPGTLYVTAGNRVYEVAVSGTTSTWASISTGLPGGNISQLWAAHVTEGNGEGPAATLLRVSVPTRGVWELSLPEPQNPSAPVLYVRDNVRDLGWLDTATDGGADPYTAGGSVWHYQCADIKVDARNPGNGSSGPFFQTDPEGASLPIDHTLFDQLNDNSQNLPTGDQAMVHVQVHNRSLATTTQVQVWAIVCNASAGVPALSSGSFDFWSQFHSTGAIIPALPPGGPWSSVGNPIVLQPVDAAHPQIASWQWSAPIVGPGDSGHYCIMTFVHSAASPLSLTTSSGDDATVESVQVGQKNLHIGPPLPPTPKPGGGAGGPGGRPGARPFSEVIEFHNPEVAPRLATLVFDFRLLHPNIQPTLFFPPLTTTVPMLAAVTGYTKLVKAEDSPSGVFGKLLQEGRELLGELDRIEDAIEDRLRVWFGWGHEHDPDDDWKIDVPSGFDPVGWVAQRSGILEVRGVSIAAGEHTKALISLAATGPLPHGERFQFEVQQVVGGRVVGGSTYIVPVAGRPKLPISLAPSDDNIVYVAEGERYMQPWLAQAWLDREKQQGRV